MIKNESRTIELDLPELICIEHTLAPSETVSAKSEDRSAATTRETCLKVGAALLDALDEERPVAVSFDEAELWLLRERLSIYSSQGARADLGLVVKSKVYQALLSIYNEREADSALGGVFPVADTADAGPSRQEVDDAVRKWKKASGQRLPRGKGGSGTGADGPSDDPPDGAEPGPPPEP
ncbi:MAG: hypothetical protein HY678_01235 [Chloroflexi bacterium]|nr:hypothetical protein [Chloroflexota bacterium]